MQPPKRPAHHGLLPAAVRPKVPTTVVAAKPIDVS